jgi:hypothetical protein
MKEARQFFGILSLIAGVISMIGLIAAGQMNFAFTHWYDYVFIVWFLGTFINKARMVVGHIDWRINALVLSVWVLTLLIAMLLSPGNMSTETDFAFTDIYIMILLLGFPVVDMFDMGFQMVKHDKN